MSPNRFVVLAQPRTGSTLVCSLICSHPGVRCLIEPINPATHDHHMRPLPGGYSSCLMPEAMVQHNIYRAMDILFAKEAPPDKWVLSKREATLAAGFKIMAHQVQALKSEEKFWEYLHRFDVKVLLVFRKNILMQYISDLITTVTREPTCWLGTPKIAKVQVPIDSLGSNLHRIQRERKYLLERSKLLDRRRLTYEEFKDTVEPVEQLLHWLTGEQYVPFTRLQKQNPDSIRDRVTNYKALVDELRRLGFDHLIVDS